MRSILDLEQLEANDGIDHESLMEFERANNFTLPDVLRDLLAIANGFSIAGGLLLYGTADIVERNATWEVDVYAPAFIAIGDTGGGEVILMSLRESDPPIYLVGSGSMAPGDMICIGESLAEWLRQGCPTAHLS